MLTPNYSTIDVTKPVYGRKVITGSYWLCKDGDPKQAVFYKEKYPQCNTQKAIIERGIELAEKEANCTIKVVFIEVAYAPDYH